MKENSDEKIKDLTKLGDPNYFGVEEAMDYSIKTGQLRYEVFGRKDVQEFLKNIPLKEAVNWGAKRDNWEVWKIILGRQDVNFAEALNCAEKETSSAVWQIVLERIDIQEYLNTLPVVDAIIYAEKSGRIAVKEFLYKRLDVQDYIKNLNTTKN